jgi:hypothetical protein
MWELICFILAATPILIGLTCVGGSLWERRPQPITARAARGTGARGGSRPGDSRP